MPAEIVPVLDRVALGATRAALADFTPDAVQELLGPSGSAAHLRGDLTGVARALPSGERLATLVRLFLLGLPVDEATARSALHPLDPAAAPEVLECSAGSVRALLEVRPYSEAPEGPPWHVFSDFGTDVRPGPLAPDHVLGVGAASLTLVQAVPRSTVRRALDLGTGSGVQALHLSRHVEQVTGTDVSPRALRLAATTAALSGVSWDLREGSLLDPIPGETFDLVVANPPFVVSPGLAMAAGGYDYRDSGLPGDDICRTLLTEVPGSLAPGGTASMLANWIVPDDGAWADRLHGWLADRGCDAWVWQREVAEPGAYVAMWLRDAGEVPGSRRWVRRYDEWLDWFDAHGVAAVGMGLVTLWRTDAADPVILCEDVPQAVEQPAGAHLGAWVERQRWLRTHDDAALLQSHPRCAGDVVRVRQDVCGPDGWQTRLCQLRQTRAMRWEIEADDAIASLLAACDGRVPLDVVVRMLAASLDASADEVEAAVLPVVRDLFGRGFLDVPAGAEADGRPA